jgi:isopenicillin N synthase-like dioxygenase
MPETIPVINIADYLTRRAGALDAVAVQVREALTTVGFSF